MICNCIEFYFRGKAGKQGRQDRTGRAGMLGRPGRQEGKMLNEALLLTFTTAFHQACLAPVSGPSPFLTKSPPSHPPPPNTKINRLFSLLSPSSNKFYKTPSLHNIGFDLRVSLIHCMLDKDLTEKC